MPHPNRGLFYLMKAIRCMFVCFLVAGQAPPAAAQPKYTVQDLGALNGSNSFPPGPVAGIYAVGGINNSGQVIGSFITVGLNSHAFRTAPNSAIDTAKDDLRTLGGFFKPASPIHDSRQSSP